MNYTSTKDRLLGETELIGAIDKLRRERNAVILAHYYQDAPIQDLADFVGDSLDLSRKAAATDADVILFCGVHFMAEVAKILSPSKTVIIPDMEAGCSLEKGCQPADFRKFREANPDHLAVTYINCSAEIKALSDVIVTSSNAAHIVAQLPADKPILFAPDKYLGAWVAKQTGRDLTLWDGSCEVHEQFSEEELLLQKQLHPEALVAAHPECPESVLRHADCVGSTRVLLDYVINTDADEFIIATESHIIHQMEKAAPRKRFYSAPGSDGTCKCANCPYMGLNTLEKLHRALATMSPTIEMDEDLRKRAEVPLQRMLDLSPSAKK